MGFCSKVKVFFLQCDWSVSNFLSEEFETEKGSRGRKFFEVNLRAVIAFREMGKGDEGLNTFARLMNMKGITWASYKNIDNAVFDAYGSVAEESMRKVALHIRRTNNPKNTLITPQSHFVLCQLMEHDRGEAIHPSMVLSLQ